jgi:integrase
MMAGTGMEWQATERVRRSDVDFATRKIHAHGGKTKYRDRIVRVTEDWTWPIIESYARDFTPNALLFDGLDHKDALKVHREAAESVRLPDSTLHDWRHTYAVNALKDGTLPAVVKRQLGHAPNSTVVERVYSVWIVTDEDYDRTVGKTGKRRQAGRK